MAESGVIGRYKKYGLGTNTQEKMFKTQAWDQGIFGVGFHQKSFCLGIFILL